jgi:hypothetical protein
VKGVTTLRELPAKFSCVVTINSVEILAANSPIFAAKASSTSLKSIVASLTYCSSTSPSILALRVLGLRSALLSTFPFYDWLVLTRPRLYNPLLDLSFLKALILTSTLVVADWTAYGILGLALAGPRGSTASLTYEYTECCRNFGCSYLAYSLTQLFSIFMI